LIPLFGLQHCFQHILVTAWRSRLWRQQLPRSLPHLPRATQQNFLRLITTPALQKAYGAEGLSNADALLALETLQLLPQVCVRDEGPGLTHIWHRLATRDSASPQVWMGCLPGRVRNIRFAADADSGSGFQKLLAARVGFGGA
jgi:hypothetical protein